MGGIFQWDLQVLIMGSLLLLIWLQVICILMMKIIIIKIGHKYGWDTNIKVIRMVHFMESNWIKIQDITYVLIRIKLISQNWCDQLSNY